ncbi:AGAP007109-PA-like protein [Anopheles sinensis]|uniref:AGAP007109-PA-like protein n=1 Tax=Anopheles sinensis TaxID=74873 RepID=A0A084VZ62_ANOSI|nr:AGAP007109-PA-like protein [Anopheles sinensis]
MTMDIKQSRMNVKINSVAPDGQIQLSELPQHQNHHSHQGTTKLPESGLRGSGRGAAGKRSFDVAFLMLPDEKLTTNGRNGKQPRIRQQPPPSPSPTIDVESDSTQSEPRSEDLSLKSGFSPIRSPDHVAERHFNLDMLRQRALLVDHHQHSQPLASAAHQQQPHESMLPGGHERLAYLFPGARFYEHPFGSLVRGEFPPGELPRSAFSKVTSVSVPTESPLPPLSPDRHSCPSTSPPISLSPGSQTSGAGFRAYEYGPFLSPSPGSPAPGSSLSAVGESLARKSASPAKHGLQGHVTIPLYHHPNDPSAPGGGSPYFPSHPFGLPSPFGGGPGGGPGQTVGGHQAPPPPPPPGGHPGGLHPQHHHQAGGPNGPLLPEVDGLIRNPAAAAILSTLLPSAMSTFTLSAQNVCAKCNISFRMTSDLVYHMRSHHKSEHVHDHARRKREDKLKCPVCNESFRERHHLTRHMTAHQDKAGDLLEKTTSSSSGAAASASNKRALEASRHHQQQQHLNLPTGGGGAGGRHA